eukprot:g19163.t1
MKRDCIPDRSFSNGFEQPHADVVTPGYPFSGFGGGGSASWKDPWGDIPWQGQQQEGTPPGSVGMTTYGGAYAPVSPKPDAGELADSTAYRTAYILQPSPPSIQRQQQQQQQQQDFGSVSEQATVGGAAGQPESQHTRSSSTSAASEPGGRAPSSALAGVSSDIGDDEIQDCGGPSVWSVAMAPGLKDMMFSG